MFHQKVSSDFQTHWLNTDGSIVPRHEFMRVLVHVESILIPVSFHRQATESRYFYLIDYVLGRAGRVKIGKMSFF